MELCGRHKDSLGEALVNCLVVLLCRDEALGKCSGTDKVSGKDPVMLAEAEFHLRALSCTLCALCRAYQKLHVSVLGNLVSSWCHPSATLVLCLINPIKLLRLLQTADDRKIRYSSLDAVLAKWAQAASSEEKGDGTAVLVLWGGLCWRMGSATSPRLTSLVLGPSLEGGLFKSPENKCDAPRYLRQLCPFRELGMVKNFLGTRGEVSERQRRSKKKDFNIHVHLNLSGEVSDNTAEWKQSGQALLLDISVYRKYPLGLCYFFRCYSKFRSSW